MKNMPLAREEDRLLVELADLYDVWLAASQFLYTGRYRWRPVSGTDYLLRIEHGQSNGTSLGPRNQAREALFEQGAAAEETVKATWDRLALKGRMLKAARVPAITDTAGAALRALDVAGLLGTHIQVVGSTAFPAYEVAAGVKCDPLLHATEDADVSWVGPALEDPTSSPLLTALKRADSTWTVNTERPFQLRNRCGDILDVLVAPSLLSSYPTQERIRAVSTLGQEDLVGGVPLERVIIDSAGLPVRIVAPDPRLFALHKIGLSQALGRRVEKRGKDARQGQVLLALVRQHMPEYPFDDAFLNGLSPALRSVFQQAVQVSEAAPSDRVRLSKSGPKV